jgi:hypothetical protein
MRRLIKTTLNRIPYSSKIINSYYFYKLINYADALVSGKKLKSGNHRNIFTHYYKENVWENDESISGDGSTLEYTENIRKEIPVLLAKYNIQKMLDAPCGDYNWFRHITRDEKTFYIGGDVVAELVRSNNERYGNQNTSFIELDVTENNLPDADLWLCRDLLFHFSYRDIFLTLDNFLNSNIKYLLASSHHECKANTDILTGQFRLLNLELAPFNFRPPISSMDDWIEGFPVRKLCLWEKETIAEFLSENKDYLEAVKSKREA